MTGAKILLEYFGQKQQPWDCALKSEKKCNIWKVILFVFDEGIRATTIRIHIGFCTIFPFLEHCAHAFITKIVYFIVFGELLTDAQIS